MNKKLKTWDPQLETDYIEFIFFFSFHDFSFRWYPSNFEILILINKRKKLFILSQKYIKMLCVCLSLYFHVSIDGMSWLNWLESRRQWLNNWTKYKRIFFIISIGFFGYVLDGWIMTTSLRKRNNEREMKTKSTHNTKDNNMIDHPLNRKRFIERSTTITIQNEPFLNVNKIIYFTLWFSLFEWKKSSEE